MSRFNSFVLLFLWVLHGACIWPPCVSAEENSSSSRPVQSQPAGADEEEKGRAAREFPGLQVPGEPLFLPAESTAGRKEQMRRDQDDLKRSRDRSKAIMKGVQGDKAILAAVAKVDAFSQALAEEARKSNGRSRLPKDFYEKRDAIAKEYDLALHAALGEDLYDELMFERKKQQILMRRLMFLRSYAGERVEP